MKKFLKWTGIVLLVIALIGFTLYMVYLRPFMQKMKITEVVQIDPLFTVITGGGGNTGILVSDSLILVIDTKMNEAADDLLAKVNALRGNRALLVINTHWHPDHVGGNQLFGLENVMAGGSYTKEDWIKQSGEKSLPTRWVKSELRIPLGDDTATVINLAHIVHTPSDVLIYLHKRKTLFSGDVILNKQAPVVIGGADGEAYITAMEDIQRRFDIKRVVPGHGMIGGPEVIAQFYTFFNDMKTAASDPSQKNALIKKYDDWNQVPLLMSPSAVVRHFKSKK